MKLRLSQTFPWSNEERMGFFIAVGVTALLATAFMAATVPDTIIVSESRYGIVRGSNPQQRLVPLTFPVVAGVLLLLNFTPLKRLHGLVQYSACVIVGACVGIRDLTIRDDGWFMVPVYAFMGVVWFMAFRVNWWFYWDVPSRRSITERMIGSVFFTIPAFGLIAGVWRLVVGAGVHDMSTTFVAQTGSKGKTLETIIEDPALIDHVRRMKAIRSAKAGIGTGRKPSEAKQAVSESI